MALGDAARINTNIAAFNALAALKRVNLDLEKRQLRLATGLRINEVSDDPAGFVISRRLDARIRGLSTALDNVGTTKNVLSIAEGGLLSISDILISMKNKLIQAANDTLGSAERNAIRSEIVQLTAEIDDIVEETNFNKNALLDGTYTGKSFQTGEENTNVLLFSITSNSSASGLGIDLALVGDRLFTASGASFAQAQVDAAIDTLSDTLQNIGAIIGRLTVKEGTLRIAITNTEAAKSRILDADIAREQVESTRLQILQQTATAQLAQANISPQNVLALFQ
ncbi:flagellin [candidate division KSB1 bacterium]|nr:flagellin [candidate division KSB1 bacterium]